MATGVAPDEVVLAGYWDISLTGLETMKFTEVSGLSHSVEVTSQPVGTTTGPPADARVVSTPKPMTLTMSHVVLTTMDLWTWLDETILTRAGAASKKSGTLTIKELGTGMLVKSWRLDDVYLTGVSLDTMGSGGSMYLTASLTVVAGQCVPM